MKPDEISKAATLLALKMMTVAVNEKKVLEATFGAPRDDCDAVLISALAKMALSGRQQTGVDYPQMLIDALTGPPK